MIQFIVNAAQFFIDRPLIKWIALLLVCVGFVFSARNLKRYSFPQVDLKQLVITTVAPGWSPKEIDIDVTQAIEKELDSVNGIEKYTSLSRENISRVEVFIDDESDIESVKREIRTAVDRVVSLPESVKNRPYIFEVKSENFGAFEFGMYSKSGDLLNVKEHLVQLKKRLQRLPGIARINEINVPEKEIQILLDRDKLRNSTVAMSDVFDAIRTSKKRLFAGKVGSQQNVKNITTYSEFETPERIGSIIVRSTSTGLDDGTILRIQDLGDVRWELSDEENTLTRYNGYMGFGLEIIKLASYDVIDMVDSVYATIESFEQEISDSDIGIIVLGDESFETRTRLKTVFLSALLGIFLVFVTLIVFLNFRIAFFTALSVPIALFFTFILMYIFNISINSLSLMGIIITIGIIVDGAVIVSERIYVYREQGLGPVEASVQGLKSILVPLLLSETTTFVAFSAMFFFPGVLGLFIVEIPIIVTLMLVGSLLEAGIFLPSHIASHPTASKKAIGDAFVQKLRNLYVLTLKKILHRPYVSLVSIFTGFTLIGILCFNFFIFALFPLEQAFFIEINGEVEENASLYKTEERVRQLEDIITTLPAGVIKSYKSTIGGFIESKFSISLILSPFDDRDMTITEVKDYIFAKVLERDITFISLDFSIDTGGPPSGKPVEINVYGENEEERKVLIEEIERDLKELGLSEVNSNLRTSRLENQVIPKDRAYFAKVQPIAIAETLRAAFQGILIADVHTEDQKVEIRVRLDKQSIDYENPIQDLYVRNSLGQYIDIEDIVRLETKSSTAAIYRQNGEAINTISGHFNLEKTSSQEVYKKLSVLYSDISERYPGLWLEIGGEAEETADTFITMVTIFTLSILAIYLLFVIQFNRLTQPFIVVFAIPIGTLGCIAFLILHGAVFSLFSLMGIIGFGGLVVNVSMILVEFINRRKVEREADFKKVASNFGVSRKRLLKEVILSGSKDRFRPVFITSISTFAGLAPAAYGFGLSLDHFISPIALAIMWGIFFGTLGSLYIIPLMYYINEQLSFHVLRRWKFLRKVYIPVFYQKKNKLQRMLLKKDS